jgi:O-acetyl-ADP-ribose deacetylase (regulator of RNase III)
MTQTLREVKGDLMSVKAGVIAHGCNCRGAFGAGVAGAIARTYPFVRECYNVKFRRPGWNLGDVQFTYPTEYLIIANCATQDKYGEPGVLVDYDAVSRCMEKVLAFCKEKGLCLSIPRIGCGLAGGDWNRVKDIILEANAGKDVDITVYYL